MDEMGWWWGALKARGQAGCCNEQSHQWWVVREGCIHQGFQPRRRIRPSKPRNVGIEARSWRREAGDWFMWLHVEEEAQ